MATLVDLRAELKTLEAKRLEIIENGQELQITGAFGVKNVGLSEINAEISRVRKKILRKLGYGTRRSQPDFS